jgi:hypothetical protein
MVRAPNQGGARLLVGKESCVAAASRARWHTLHAGAQSSVFVYAVRCSRSAAPYLAPVALAYLRRNLSTRPAVSTIFCLPV